MSKNTYYHDFLEFAIKNEIEAAMLYEKYSQIVKAPAQRRLLSEMAAFERGHEKKLREYLITGKADFPDRSAIHDLQIADFLVEIQLNAESSIQDVWIFAMKAEQKAFELYEKLADLEESTKARELFHNLALEEKKHKHDLEAEYEKGIMGED